MTLKITAININNGRYLDGNMKPTSQLLLSNGSYMDSFFLTYDKKKPLCVGDELTQECDGTYRIEVFLKASCFY